jgi:hypothetical protein
MSKGSTDLIKLCTTDEHGASPETVRRVLDIADMIIEGEPRYKLIERIKEKYNIKYQMAVRYYDAALRYLVPSEEEQEGFREKMQAKLLARYEALYKDAVDRHSTKIAKEILDSMAKVYGVAGGDKVIVREDQQGNKEITISFD